MYTVSITFCSIVAASPISGNRTIVNVTDGPENNVNLFNRKLQKVALMIRHILDKALAAGLVVDTRKEMHQEKTIQHLSKRSPSKTSSLRMEHPFDIFKRSPNIFVHGNQHTI